MADEQADELTCEQRAELIHYRVWQLPVRIFHWINAVAIMGMIATGLVILNGKFLSIGSDGKIVLKIIHVYLGYGLIANLLIRLVWGFIANRYANWANLLLLDRVYWRRLVAYCRGFINKDSALYAGHNPLGQLMVLALFLLLLIQSVTGLILAGTDVYMPPLGGWVEESIRESADFPLIAGSKENIDLEKYKTMRELRKPVITTHYYVFYILVIAVFFHILGVVVTEIRERSGLVSGMITGSKVFHQRPNDWD